MQVLADAFYIASTGRPGPVLIDLPKDMMTGTVPDEIIITPKPAIRGYQPTRQGHPRQIEKAADLIAEDMRPSSVS